MDWMDDNGERVDASASTIERWARQGAAEARARNASNRAAAMLRETERSGMRYGRDEHQESAADALLREAGYGPDGRNAEEREPEVLAEDLDDLIRAAAGTTDTAGVERVERVDEWADLAWAERHADAGAPVMRSSWIQPTHGRARMPWRTADTFVHSDGRTLAVASPILFVRPAMSARWIMASKQTPTDIRGRRALWGRKRIHASDAARKRATRASESPEAADARRAANAQRMRERRAAARAAAVVDAPAQ